MHDLWKLLIFIASTLPLPLAAQDPAPDIIYTTRLFDTVLTYAPPPWVTTREEVENVETFRNQAKTENGTDFFIMEFIPKGESFDDWHQLYAIYAETPLEGPVEGYRNGQIQTYLNACTDATWQISDPSPGTVTLFIIYCPSYTERPEQGEVAIFSMMRAGKTLVKNYYHMRLPAFSVEDQTGPEENWPIDRAMLGTAISRIAAARLNKAE